jgi:hypothetical protein
MEVVESWSFWKEKNPRAGAECNEKAMAALLGLEFSLD